MRGPALRDYSVVMDAGLVSISHWGVFDIAPYGAIIRFAHTVEWRLGNEIISEKYCDTHEFMKFFRAVGR